jgi:Dolichyl-phosphate-mannose-protein mannosyltransferase
MQEFPVSRVPLLQDPPFVLWLIVIAFCLGRRALGILDRSATTNRTEAVLFSTALGLGMLSYVPYGLGMVGALSSRNLWIATGLLSLVAVFDVGRFLATRTRNDRPSRDRSWGPPDLLVYGGIIGLGLLLSILIGLAPPSDPDGLFYHLTAPKRWLQAGSLRYLPSFVHTNGPMSGQMLFTWVVGIWSDTSTKLVHFAFGVVGLGFLIQMGMRLGSARVGVLAAALWFLGMNFLGTLGATSLFSVAYVDLNLTAFSLAAVHAFLLFVRSRRWSWAVTSALLSGFALTVKLTGLFVGGALTAALFIHLLASKERIPSLVAKCGAFGSLALLPALPWFFRSWSQTGSPIYLMLANVFETRDWSPAAGRAFGDFFKYYVWGGGHSSAHWSLGLRKAVRLGALLFVLAGGGLAIFRIRRVELRIPLFVFICVALASIAGTGLYLRYLVPFSGLLFVVALTLVSEQFFLKRWVQVLVALGLVGNLGLFVKSAFPSLANAVKLSLGIMTREEFMPYAFGPANDLWVAINQNATPRDQVLLAAGRPSYYIDPYTVITEAYYQERLRMDTWEHYVEDVKRDRFALLVVPLRAERSNLIGPAYPAADNEIPFAHRLAQEHGTKLGTFGNDELYRLDPALYGAPR